MSSTLRAVPIDADRPSLPLLEGALESLSTAITACRAAWNAEETQNGKTQVTRHLSLSVNHLEDGYFRLRAAQKRASA